MQFENVLKRILIFLLICSTFNYGVLAEGQLGDPYRILGLERKASPQEIRQAYKKLVKKWCDIFQLKILLELDFIDMLAYNIKYIP